MNRSMKVRLVLLAVVLLVFMTMVVAAPSANAAGPSLTVKVAVRNTNIF